MTRPKYNKSEPFNHNLLPEENIDAQVVKLVPKGSNVLELGCATGYISEYLIKENLCSVTGIELDLASSELAKDKATKIICGDLETSDTWEKIYGLGQFDIIMACAVLEHLKAPDLCLKRCKDALIPTGKMLITLPNINHWSARLRFAFGKFHYDEYGLFDNTHLRFFTFYTAKKMFDDIGLIVEYVSFEAKGMPIISGILRRILGKKGENKFYNISPDLFAYQMLFVCRKDNV